MAPGLDCAMHSPQAGLCANLHMSPPRQGASSSSRLTDEGRDGPPTAFLEPSSWNAGLFTASAGAAFIPIAHGPAGKRPHECGGRGSCHRAPPSSLSQGRPGVWGLQLPQPLWGAGTVRTPLGLIGGWAAMAAVCLRTSTGRLCLQPRLPSTRGTWRRGTSPQTAAFALPTPGTRQTPA